MALAAFCFAVMESVISIRMCTPEGTVRFAMMFFN